MGFPGSAGGWTAGPKTASGVGDGCLALQLGQVVKDGDGVAVALEALLGGVSRLTSRSAWRAFSSIARRSTSAVSASARRSPRDRERVAVALEPRESSSPARSFRSRRRLDVVGDLEPAGVLRAPRPQPLERALELAGHGSCRGPRP